ncbi:carboxypeptidase-like regulatory domain-containing protein, partial [Klebsiella pneumoniae]|nr:carboxypeptidase-like regulatory domain-containing protein [Klebsiella pneumoniae]
NFVGTAAAGAYAVTGVVRDRQGQPLRGVTLTLSGPTTRTVKSSRLGKFAFKGLVNGSYTLTASRAGFSFKPASRTLLIQGA